MVLLNPAVGACLLGLTQPAPGHNGSRVASGYALQDGRLMDVDGQVLRT